MAYAILRLRKLVSGEALDKALEHNLRRKDVPNADPTLPVYELSGEDGDPVMVGQRRLAAFPPKSPKSPTGLEVLTTMSPEWATAHKDKVGQWAKTSREWLYDTFGRDAVVSCALHMDETTPHIHAVVMPVVMGRVDVRPWTDGPERLRAMQDSYASATKHLGLDRGISGAASEHTTVREFYKSLESEFLPGMPKPIDREGALDYCLRVEPAWKAMAARAILAEKAINRVKELEKLLASKTMSQERPSIREIATGQDISL